MCKHRKFVDNHNETIPQGSFDYVYAPIHRWVKITPFDSRTVTEPRVRPVGEEASRLRVGVTVVTLPGSPDGMDSSGTREVGSWNEVKERLSSDGLCWNE